MSPKAQPKRISVEQVAQNILSNVTQAKMVIHAQVYANLHKWPPQEILAALGAHGEPLIAWLTQAEQVLFPPMAPKPEKTKPATSGQ